jgi:hypothetical protein
MNLYYDIPISQIITDFSKHHRFLDFYTIPYSVEYIFLRNTQQGNTQQGNTQQCNTQQGK